MTVNLNDLFVLAPNILNYLIPGCIFLYIFRKIACVELDAVAQWVASVAISYCTIAVVETVISKTGRVFNFWESVFWYIIVDIALGFCCSITWKSKWVTEFMKSKVGATLSDGALHNAFDWNQASYICVYLKSEDWYFAGNLVMADDKPDGWITISAPVQYSANHDVIATNQNDLNVIMAIPIADIKRIRIIN